MKEHLVGTRFGRLTVLEVLGTPRVPKLRVTCDCGKTKVVRYYDAANGRTNSCGCLRRETTRAQRLKHGMIGTPEFAAWQHMIQRCTNPHVERYPRYGGRGIRVCKEWQESFEVFLKDVGPRPSPRHQLDRKDNDGHYEPGNARWVLRRRNDLNKSTTVYLTFCGERLPLVDWAEKVGLPDRTLRDRIKRKWPVERALTTPHKVLGGVR